MSNSVSNGHLAPEIYAASRRMKGKSTETVVGDLTTKTFHDRQQQLNPHSVVGANLKKEEDASLHGRTAPVRGNLYGDMTDSPLYPRERPVNTSGHSATSVQWQCAQDAQGRTREALYSLVDFDRVGALGQLGLGLCDPFRVPFAQPAQALRET